MTISPKCRKLAVRCLLALLAVLLLLSGTVALAEDSYGMSTSSFNVTVQADRDHTFNCARRSSRYAVPSCLSHHF